MAKIRCSVLLCAAVLCVAGGCGCGSGQRHPSGAHAYNATTPGEGVGDKLANLSERDGDGDIDTLGKGRNDSDNDAVPTYGTAARALDRAAIVAAIHHYYVVAATGSGATACSLLDPLAAEMVVEHHHRGMGPPSLQGRTCAQIVSQLFKQRRRELAKDVDAFRVTYVRVRGNRGDAYVPFTATREVEIVVRRKEGVWRMDVPLDNGAV